MTDGWHDMDSKNVDFPRGFDAHRRTQAELGLRMTPAERLRWLEETMDDMRLWLGRALQPRPPRSDDAAPASFVDDQESG